MTQDAQSVTQQALEALNRSREGWDNAVELGLIPPQHRNAATILADECRNAAHRLASQPTSAEDARKMLADAYEQGALDVHAEWLRAHDAGEGPPRGDPEFGEAARDHADAALDPFNYMVATPDTQTAAIGAEAEDTRLVCEQCGKAGALFCDHVSRGAAYLSQPVAAPQAEMAGDDYRQKLRMVISHASGGHLSDEADVERSINDICVQISQHHNRVWEAALEKGRKEVTPLQPEGGTVADSDLRETFYYLCKWVERGLFDKNHTLEEALQVIAYHPGLPWKKGRWDVDHKPYAAEFYKAFPKAALQPEKTK